MDVYIVYENHQRFDEGFSAPAAVFSSQEKAETYAASRLGAKWEISKYTVDDERIDIEIRERETLAALKAKYGE